MTGHENKNKQTKTKTKTLVSYFDGRVFNLSPLNVVGRCVTLQTCRGKVQGSPAVCYRATFSDCLRYISEIVFDKGVSRLSLSVEIKWKRFVF